MNGSLMQVCTEQSEVIQKLLKIRESDAKYIAILEELNEKRAALQKNSDELIKNLNLLVNLKTGLPDFLYLLYEDWGYEGDSLSLIFPTFEAALKYIEVSDLSFITNPYRFKDFKLVEWNLNLQQEVDNWSLYHYNKV